MTKQLSVTDIKVFAPSKDYKLSLSFYRELGWKLLGDHGSLAELEIGGMRFFLQKYYHKGWANNFMFYINVEDVNAWYEHATEVIKNGNYGKARIKAPEKQPHGDIVCYVWDPSGILLHFAQRLEE